MTSINVKQARDEGLAESIAEIAGLDMDDVPRLRGQALAHGRQAPQQHGRGGIQARRPRA
jgi:hypothetical protein